VWGPVHACTAILSMCVQSDTETPAANTDGPCSAVCLVPPRQIKERETDLNTSQLTSLSYKLVSLRPHCLRIEEPKMSWWAPNFWPKLAKLCDRIARALGRTAPVSITCRRPPHRRPPPPAGHGDESEQVSRDPGEDAQLRQFFFCESAPAGWPCLEASGDAPPQLIG
jgi:hypothetical protein